MTPRTYRIHRHPYVGWEIHYVIPSGMRCHERIIALCMLQYRVREMRGCGYRRERYSTVRDACARAQAGAS